MTLTIEFAPQTEAWLSEQADRLGVPPAEVVKKLVDEQASASTDEIPAAAVALLDRWFEEDATNDPDTLRKADEEYGQLKRSLNANRAATGERPVF